MDALAFAAPAHDAAAPDTTRLATPALLLHSSGASSRQWRLLAAQLGTRRAVHLHDFLGHGGRAGWVGPRELRMADEASPIVATLERLGGAHLVAHSYGGAVAFHIACHHPGLVHSLVAFEPVLPRLLAGDPQGDPMRHGARQLRRSAEAGEFAHAAAAFVDFWSGPGAWAQLTPAQQNGVAATVPALVDQLDALYGDSPRAGDVVGLGIPLLVLHGDATVPMARQVARRLAVLLPRARVETLSADAADGPPTGVGHLGPITHAPAFNRRVEAFLRERDAA